MPGKLKAKIVAGRHLPVMDRASDLTDAFVEVKFGNTTFKTDVFPKSLNPQWNSEWFKFEVDDEDLQDEPLQITVLDHDTYSANDAIGKVYIDIDPLLSCEAATIYVLVKVDLFNDLNRFRQSSCGVKFFCTTSIPRCYRVALVHGFVEELVVNEDPEYQSPLAHGCRSTHNSPVHSTCSSQRLSHSQNFSVSVPTLVFTGTDRKKEGECEGGRERRGGRKINIVPELLCSYMGLHWYIEREGGIIKEG
ncbi:unnamed protein product [Coregonus sp. 'balchen']|nr:unnamed protein product [Coregonus sp. 'balchen']